MPQKAFLCFVFSLIFISSHAQTIKGNIMEENNKIPVEFVNIGIKNKNIGTVSDQKGNFSLKINAENSLDTLLFSCIGFETYGILIADLVKKDFNIIPLKIKSNVLKEVIVKPTVFKEKFLGAKSSNKGITIGFLNNNLGYEAGLFIKNKKKAYLKVLNVNLAECSYDTVYCRINVYEVDDNKNFVNVLAKPIYVNITKSDAKSEISIDISSKNILVNGNFLVSFEYVKNHGEGRLMFSTALFHQTWARKTSQGKWESYPIGIGVSVLADVEK